MSDYGDFCRDRQRALGHRRCQAYRRSLWLLRERGFTKHTTDHFSTTVSDCRLDWWPAGEKWRYRDKTYHGGAKKLKQFIDRRNAEAPDED